MKKLLLFLLSFYSAGHAFAQSQNALDFDGIDDEVIVPNASSLIAGSNQLSITCWVYPTNAAPMYPDFDGFAGFRNEIDCDFYVMQISPSTAIEARLRNSAGGFFTITYQGLNLNVWQHLAVTFDGSMMRLYVGGVKADSVAASGGITNMNEAFHIGSLPYNANPYWLTGKVDEISLWNRALTPTEISCISQESVNAADPGCMLFYTCNQGTANGNNTSITTLDDESGHIDGVLTNFAMISTFSNFVAGVSNASSVAHTICQGDSYQFGSDVLTQPGFYYTTSPLNGGCGNLQELNLFVIPVDTSVSLAGETLTAGAAGAAYQWADCNNGYSVIQGETGQSFSPSADGSYALIITTGGCTDTSSCYTVTNVGMHENDFTSHLYLYPNPAGNKFSMGGLPAGNVFDLTITDALGNLLLKSTANTGEPTVDVSDWMPGIYFVEVKSGKHTARLRMTKEK
jgi:hypothetical protein